MRGEQTIDYQEMPLPSTKDSPVQYLASSRVECSIAKGSQESPAVTVGYQERLETGSKRGVGTRTPSRN